MSVIDRHLEGRVALVTGASRGIGAATAHAFSDAGADVVLAARDEAALRGVADAVSRGGHATVVPTDVGDAAQVRRLVEQVLEVHGRLDFAINNAAGGGGHPRPAPPLPPRGAGLDGGSGQRVPRGSQRAWNGCSSGSPLSWGSWKRGLSCGWLRCRPRAAGPAGERRR